MRQMKLLGTALLMMLALSAMAVATASAATEVLPVPTELEPLTFTSTSGAGKLLTLGKKEIKCKKDTASGQFTTVVLGTYKVLCEESTGEAGTTCTGVGDKSGTILYEGTVHFTLGLLKVKEEPAGKFPVLAFLVKEFHFTCTILGINTLVLVLGCLAALAEPINKLTKTTKDVGLFNAANSGDTAFPEILNDEHNKWFSCSLLSSIGGSTPESSAFEGSETNEGFKKGGAAVEVLLMHP